jgi:hypothetical protein
VKGRVRPDSQLAVPVPGASGQAHPARREVRFRHGGRRFPGRLGAGGPFIAAPPSDPPIPPAALGR